MTSQSKAYLYGLAAVLLWSTVASAFKISLRYLDSFQLLLYSAIGSLIVLAALLIVRGQLGEPFRYAPGELARCALLGFLNPCLYYLVLFAAYARLPAQEAQPLNYTWAFTLALLSVPILGHRLRSRELIGGLISYGGVWIISTRGRIFSLELTNHIGVALALGSTLLWALYWLYNTRSRQNPVANLFLNFLFSLPIIFAACCLFSDPFPEGLFQSSRLPGLAGAAYIGCFEMGFTFYLWLMALRYTSSTAQIGNLIFISPFLSLIFIHFIVGETIFSSTYPGLMLIVGGLIVQKTKESKDGSGGRGAGKDQPQNS